MLQVSTHSFSYACTNVRCLWVWYA